MGTTYHIRDLSGGLRVSVTQDLKPSERLLIACIAAVAAGVVTNEVLGGIWWIVVASLAGVATFAVVKVESAQLQITKVEFVSTGALGRRVQTPRIVQTANVRGLTFRSSTNPLLSQKDGLCAVTDRGEILLLPFLDFNQTKEVIDAIEKRFPGLAELWNKTNVSTGFVPTFFS